jgi:hypothetical protein
MKANLEHVTTPLESHHCPIALHDVQSNYGFSHGQSDRCVKPLYNPSNASQAHAIPCADP